jgi:hypothetical protein
VSGRESRTRREIKRRRQKREFRRYVIEARRQYHDSLPGEFTSGPGGAFCPHYRPGQEAAITDEWTVRFAADGSYQVAACPGCMRYVFGSAAELVREWNGHLSHHELPRQVAV